LINNAEAAPFFAASLCAASGLRLQFVLNTS
jgi:hypothetical protein